MTFTGGRPGDACAGRPGPTALRLLALGVAVCLGAWLTVPTPTSAQSTAAARLAWADSLFLREQPGKALRLLDSLWASPAGAEYGVDIQLARGRILATIGQGRPAETALRAALAALPAELDSLRWARLQRWLAVALDLQGRGGDEVRVVASASLASAMRRGDRTHEAYARLTLAYSDLRAGELAAAQAGYERSLALFEALGIGRFAPIALTGLGNCYAEQGDLERARSCYARVAAMSRAQGDPFTEGHALNNLGNLTFSCGDPAAAVEAYRRAYALQREHGNPEGSIIPAKNIATALTDMGRLEDAAQILMEALAICAEQGYAAHRAMLLEQLGIVRRQQGRLPDAIAILRTSLEPAAACSAEQTARSLIALARALALADSSTAGLALLEARVEPLRAKIPVVLRVQVDRAWGELLLQAERPAAALLHFRRAEATAAQLGMATERLAPLALAGRCLLRLAEPDSALAILQRAAQVWEVSRARSQDPEWRERFGADARQLFADLAALTLDHPLACPESLRTREAFDRLQRFKARTLRERMLGPLPVLADSGSAPAVEAVTLARLQTSVLEDGELLLDAFFGPESLLLFAVDRRECRVLRPTEAGSALEVRLQRLRGLLADPHGSGAPAETAFVAEACARLGALLLEGSEDLIRRNRRLLFSPDGALNLIPLGVLRSPGDAAQQLLATHEILRVPSATVLAALRERGIPAAPHAGAPRLLAVAGRQADGESALPGALGEIRWLGRRYRGVDARLAGEATVGLSPADLAGFQVLHFAAHTRLDDQHPWRSALQLAGGADEEPGTTLQAAQIAACRLPARLAVLAACESAGGTILSGEGVLGLTSAFAAAGVPAVVASLWPVNDEVTSALTRRFYRELERGVATGAALRSAQLALAADERTARPFYWAGFVLVGDGGESLALARAANRRLAAGGLIGGLLVVAGLLLGRRRLRGAWRRTRGALRP